MTPVSSRSPSIAGSFASTSTRRAVPRPAAIRALSVGLLIGWTWFWHARTTGHVAPLAWSLLALTVLVSAVAGRLLCRIARPSVPSLQGVVPEFLVGFLFCNTLLFALVLATPFGVAVDGAIVVVAVASWGLLRRRAARPADDSPFEAANLVLVVLVGVAATLWTREAQPISHVEGTLLVHSVWKDTFVHARLTSAFAQAHGLGSMSDIMMSGGTAPVYHYASYMVPALLNAIGATTALDAYAAFQFPVGIVLMGMAAFTMVGAWRPWLGVAGTAAVLALPDAYFQGAGIRLLSFHFMSQVNLGMMYGIAVAALAWLVMVEGCRRRSRAAVVAAYALLATCVTYKAHLFVANALPLLLYPVVAFPRIGRGVRIAVGIAFVAAFVAAVQWSQASPSFPRLRPDGTGIHEYLEILWHQADPGRVRDFIGRWYLQPRWPTLVSAAIAASVVLVASFGAWTGIAVLVAWRLRSRAAFLVGLAIVNYLVMVLLLALDDRNVGATEELTNRPMAWAYFVLVAWTAAGSAWLLWRSGVRPAVVRAVFAGAALLCLGFVLHASVRLQTFPGRPELSTYAPLTGQPLCLAESARYIGQHRRPSTVVQDSALDNEMFVTALSETQAYAIDAKFSRLKPALEKRRETVRAMQREGDADAFRRFATAEGIEFYLQRPEQAGRWDATALGAPVFQCGDYRVFRFPAS